MQHLAPEGPVYQAGTLSGNPLAMRAGLTTLKALQADKALFKRLDEKTAMLHQRMKTELDKKGIAYQINRLGSMISLHFTEDAVVDFASAAKGNNPRFNAYFHAMLDQGIYLPPSAFESYFLNDALSYQDIETTVDALSKWLKPL